MVCNLSVIGVHVVFLSLQVVSKDDFLELKIKEELVLITDFRLFCSALLVPLPALEQKGFTVSINNMNCFLEAILLAEDLMKHVFEKRGLNYVPRSDCDRKRHRVNDMSPFRLVIGNAVRNGIDENLHELRIMFQQEFKSKLDAISFRRHAMKLVPDWFPEGYHPVCFIEFCVMMISTAISFHDAGYHEISSSAAEVIATVLTRQMLTDEFEKNGGWEKLVKLSTELVILHRQTSFGQRK